MAKYTGPMHVPNKRIKKLQGAPKRAMSSFLSFSQLMRSEIRLQYPNLKNTDVSSVLAQKWHEASEEAKRPHIERELRDREKYHKDMARWRAEESERATANKAQLAAELSAMEDASLKYDASPQLMSPSLWAAMIDVNESSVFGSHSPMFDEAMDGFWDTDVDIEDSNMQEMLQYAAPYKTDQLPSTSAMDVTQNASISSESNVAKVQKPVKRPKDKKDYEAYGSSYPSAHVDVQPTARQMEVQQRRQQQQQQYQMYQQHIQNQKQKSEQGKPDMYGSQGQDIDDSMAKKSKADGSRVSRNVSSAGSIVEGGRLHAQSQANQRMYNQEAHLKSQQPGYQGLQRPSSFGSYEWSPTVLGLMGASGSSIPQQSQHPSYGVGFNGNNSDRFLESSQAGRPKGTAPPQKAAAQPASFTSPEGTPSLSKSLSTQSMRSFQFEEQDQLSVMQTLMAVHRASANKAGDAETVRSLDRMQMAQYLHGQNGSQVGATHTATRTEKQDDRVAHNHSSSQSRSASVNTSKCAPLSVQQQERQNQTERQQLTDRQTKQMHDMLLRQEREQVEQREEHCYSIVSAASEDKSNCPDEGDADDVLIVPRAPKAK